jgi:hypothetical protein
MLGSEFQQILAWLRTAISIDWEKRLSELETMMKSSQQSRDHKLALARVRLIAALPLLTSVLGHPPSLYHISHATREPEDRIYRLLTKPGGKPSRLAEALGIQELTLSELGLAKIRCGGLSFGVEKLVGSSTPTDRVPGPLSVYLMPRYRRDLETGLGSASREIIASARTLITEALPWATSLVRSMEETGCFRNLLSFLPALGEGVISVGRMRWGLSWPNKELEEFLSFQWLQEEAPFDFDEVVVASRQVADKIRKMPLGEFFDRFLSWTPSGRRYYLDRNKSILWCPRCGGRTTVRQKDSAEMACRYCGQAYSAGVCAKEDLIN